MLIQRKIAKVEQIFIIRGFQGRLIGKGWGAFSRRSLSGGSFLVASLAWRGSALKGSPRRGEEEVVSKILTEPRFYELESWALAIHAVQPCICQGGMYGLPKDHKK